MQVHAAVRQGDWTDTRHGSFGSRYLDEVEALLRVAGAAREPDDDNADWRKLDALLLKRAVTVDTDGCATVGDLKARCLDAALHTGLAMPVNDEWRVWIADPASDRELADDLLLDDAELADGDLLVLNMESFDSPGYMMGMAPDAASLFRRLQLTADAPAADAGPRLFGVLLYTDADVELATYVRTHLDDLNALSGPATRIFVVEKQRGPDAVKQYWRQHLEPELYRVLAPLRWLDWQPYNAQGAYEVAAALGIDPALLPCLVLLSPAPGTEEAAPAQFGRLFGRFARLAPAHTAADAPGPADRIVFPVQEATPAFFRTLFGHLARLIGPTARPPEVNSFGRYTRRIGYRFSTPVSVQAAVRRLNAAPPADRAADREAFARVRTAEQAIRDALVPAPVAAARPGHHSTDCRVVIHSGTSGATVTENFYFQGTHTTFINKPVNTVVRDFQNTYAQAPAQEELARLLTLVLNSRDLPDADREEAASAVHDLARITAGPEPDTATARTRLQQLRELLTAGADITQPALAIVTSVAGMLGA
ncbi:hypothetical protein OG402_39920 [Streptomyces anulatus]|uniref:hypothetical protein n=1 Tax=Streptomyces anulatus TaxID=1892 RepID=UPI0022506547|nr:hypothetical protein [Streptomyces anulatus]MCX4606599.1 hypothetical protein [Streptomyces anulatus]WTD15239.1 hypothetical protein OHA54_38855 [Streptomyces anulatus]WTD23038.1 hypothetical protein OH737_00055 [Streptomyces anulatus]WTE08709.1 hypothetical protein OH765_39880 [Streptomyces anulatus]